MGAAGVADEFRRANPDRKRGRDYTDNLTISGGINNDMNNDMNNGYAITAGRRRGAHQTNTIAPTCRP